jgi:hypothetical protein
MDFLAYPSESGTEQSQTLRPWRSEKESQKAVRDAKSAVWHAEILVKDSNSFEMIGHLKKILST